MNEWLRYYRDVLAAGYSRREAASMTAYEYELTTSQIRQVVKLGKPAPVKAGAGEKNDEPYLLL